jgi:hypothetical protein
MILRNYPLDKPVTVGSGVVDLYAWGDYKAKEIAFLGASLTGGVDDLADIGSLCVMREFLEVGGTEQMTGRRVMGR